MRLRLVILLLVATAACGTASADVPSPVTVPVPATPGRHPAMLTLDRLATADVVPGVVGASVADARELLADHGLSVRVVEFEATARVTAQYPAAGAAAAGDGIVTVWTGTPPVPPPPSPAPAAPAPVEAPVEAAAQASAAPLPEPALPLPEPALPLLDTPAATATTAPEPEPGPEPEVPLDAAGSAESPASSPAAPPRTSPRVQPPSEPGLVLEGTASWYGPGFAGRTTACGDVFDPEALTLASRELRCGTRVLLTGSGGTTVEATVTDWGPAEWTGRRFDLSAATFAAIAHPGSGVITVRAETL